jgi:hypothetical protein
MRRKGGLWDGITTSMTRSDFLLQAKCTTPNVVSPLRKGETVEVPRMAPEDACAADMLVLIQWQGRE